MIPRDKNRVFINSKLCENISNGNAKLWLETLDAVLVLKS
jgi:hypothetical protein